MMLHAINQDAALTPHTRIVGVFLCGHINVEDSVRRGQAWPSAEYIADHLGIAKRTVYRAIQELEGRYFRVHRSKGRSNPNVYLPIWPPAHLDPERLGEIRQRVIEAEAEDAQTHEPEPEPRECISDTHGADGEGVEVEKGDNPAAEKVTASAPNIGERNKTTRTRETATDEPSVTGSRLGGGSAGASRAAIDSASLRSEFKKRFGVTAYRDRFAAARIVGTAIVFPSYIWATSIDRFHLFLRQHGITDILADDRKDWSVSLISRA